MHTHKFRAVPPVVLVHGNPETAEVWNPLLAQLGRTDVVTLSPPGFGQPAPSGFAATVDGYRRWLIAMLEQFREPVDLVGHSLDGMHVAQVAMSRPDLIRSWASDALGLFAPDYQWHARARTWQQEGAGEESVRQIFGGTLEHRLAVAAGIGMTGPAAERVAAGFDDGLEFATLHIEALASALVPDLVGAGVDHVLISSAGSKTGQALAFLLVREGVACTGLTRDRSAVGQDGLTVFEYQELSSVAVPPGTVFLDLAGDPRLRARIVAQCGGAVAHTLALGGTRLTGAIPPQQEGPAARPVRRYSAGPRLAEMERERGAEAVRLLRDRTRHRLLAWARDQLVVRRLDGLAAAAAVWPTIVRGSTGPERCASSRPSSVVSRGIAV